MSKTTVAKQTLADFPEVRNAENKVTEMRALLKARQDELRQAKLEYPDGIGFEAERLLTGKTGPDVAALTHQVKVASAAVEMAQAEYQRVMIHCGGVLAAEHKPEHVELIDRIRNAVAELVDSLREENEFVEGLRRMGVNELNFSRPYLDNYRDLLNQFRQVRDDEFRPL